MGGHLYVYMYTLVCFIYGEIPPDKSSVRRTCTCTCLYLLIFSLLFRWLAIRLEFVGNLIIFFAALFAAIQRNYNNELNLRINPGLVGLSISYALQITQALNFVVRMASELETNIVAVERIKEYSETPTEALPIIESHRPSDDWPREGHVKFDHYSTRYREGLDLVLKDISLDIPGGMKVSQNFTIISLLSFVYYTCP